MKSGASSGVSPTSSTTEPPSRPRAQKREHPVDVAEHQVPARAGPRARSARSRLTREPAREARPAWCGAGSPGRRRPGTGRRPRSTTVRQAPDTADRLSGRELACPEGGADPEGRHGPGEDALHGAHVLHQAGEHGRSSLIRPSDPTRHDRDHSRDPPADTRAALATARSELETAAHRRGAAHRGRHAGPYHRLQLALLERRAPGRPPVGGPPGQAAARGGGDVGPGDQRLATELSLHRGLYDALASVRWSSLAPDTRRFVEHTLRDFRRAGVDKDEPRARGSESWRTGAVRLGQDFDRAIREDVRARVAPSPRSSTGSRRTTCAAHPPGPDGKVRITTDYPDLLPFRPYADDGDARRQLYLENTSRGLPGEREGARAAPRRPRASRRDSSARRLGRLRHRGQDVAGGEGGGRLPGPDGERGRGSRAARRGPAPPAQAEGRAVARRGSRTGRRRTTRSG